jgi:addiction module HigA family antidote
MMHNPAHPGEILQEYIADLGLTISALAAHLKTSRVTLSRIVHGQSGISAEMALRLSEALGTTPEIWLKMQAQYDLWQATRCHRIKIKPIAA